MRNPFSRKQKLLFAVEAPDDKELRQYIGRTVVIEGKPMEIRTIVGNKFKPAFFEVNGKANIGILRFFAQMTGATDISEEDFLKFEEIQHDVIPLGRDRLGLH